MGKKKRSALLAVGEFGVRKAGGTAPKGRTGNAQAHDGEGDKTAAYAKLLLSLPVVDEEERERLAREGIAPEYFDNRMLMLLGALRAAQGGNASALREVLKLAAEKEEPREVIAPGAALLPLREEETKDG